MASTNPDSMTPAQGEFQPSRPRDEPLTTKGHKPGTIASEEDAAPEFNAQTLPAGSAPAANTFTPNSTSETPGQADNADTLRAHGKESTYTSAESTLGGTDSAAVHTGLGHPGQGQTTNELKKDGKHTSTREASSPEGTGATGGGGLRDLGSHEARRLADDHNDEGPIPSREHNATITGSESKDPVTAEEVANEMR